jgi:hypothetical protein
LPKLARQFFLRTFFQTYASLFEFWNTRQQSKE